MSERKPGRSFDMFTIPALGKRERQSDIERKAVCDMWKK
jgi:hypothetical protein